MPYFRVFVGGQIILWFEFSLNAQLEITNRTRFDNYRSSLLINNINVDNNKVLKSKLKIIHITNFNERHNGRLFYNTGKRINNGLVRLGHSVLEFSDRDILSNHRKLNDLNGAKYLNKKLLTVIGNYVPDLIMLGHADLVNIKTLKLIKQYYPQIKISQWFLDRMDSKWIINKKRFLNKIDIMDASFCTTHPSVLKFDVTKPIYYIPNPVDESFEKLNNFKHKELKNDVFFAMSHGVHRGGLKKGKIDDRELIINKLLKKNKEIKFDIYGMNKKQPIWGDQFIDRISNSSMGLNLSRGKPIKYYSSDRIAQLLGNGLLTFVDNKTMFGNFLNKNEIILYDNLDDLTYKIKKYKKDDLMRKKIAKNGKQKYFKYFNSTIIAEYILSKSLDYKPKTKFIWDKN